LRAAAAAAASYAPRPRRWPPPSYFICTPAWNCCSSSCVILPMSRLPLEPEGWTFAAAALFLPPPRRRINFCWRSAPPWRCSTSHCSAAASTARVLSVSSFFCFFFLSLAFLLGVSSAIAAPPSDSSSSSLERLRFLSDFLVDKCASSSTCSGALDFLFFFLSFFSFFAEVSSVWATSSSTAADSSCLDF
ncbi:hypothetical protein CI238_06114, partial [Colletotrichum incanum]